MVGFGLLNVSESEIYKRNGQFSPFTQLASSLRNGLTSRKKYKNILLQPIKMLLSRIVSKSICSLYVPTFFY
jgi:hypothetical protein